MQITRTGLAALVALCGAAGAGGAYLATRSTVDPSTVTVAASPTDTPTELTTTPSPLAPASQPATEASLASPSSATKTARPVTTPVARKTPATASPITADRNAAASDQPSTATPVSVPQSSAPEAEAVRAADTAPAVQEPDFEELIVARDVVLGLQTESSVSSETARVEDQVIAHVTRDVSVGDRVAIPSGAKAYGEVTFVERGGRLRERARLGVRFTSIVLADGSRVPISTDAIFRDGDSASKESAAKIGGGAIGGAIIGGILGGGKGAIIGSTAGAGAGTAAVMAGGRNAATLPAGTPLTIRLTRPAAVTVNR